MSLGTKTALLLSLVLAASGVVAAFAQSSRTRAHLVEGKLVAARMVADLFAASVTPALDFSDDEAMRLEVQKLEATPDIVYAAVFTADAAQPRAELSRAGGPPAGRPVADRNEILPDHIEITRVLRKDGQLIGGLVLHLSLAPEDQRFVAARRSIIDFTGWATLLAAVVVIGISRRVVATPLQRLSRATRLLEDGKAAAVEVRANDEIGELGSAFNRMAAAIVDRERRLAELNRELVQLLDGMRQGILVFGPSGELVALKSQEAERIFARREFEGLTVQDLLFPDTEGGGAIAREAFLEWLSFAFASKPESWEAVVELAPGETVLDLPDGERFLSLDFRPIEVEDRIDRVMLLATDETEKRSIERTAKEQSEEHERQMAAMRRLVAGGGQLLVSTLKRTRERLQACNDAVAAEGTTFDRALVEQLFQHVHSVKGEARAFDLTQLDASAAEAEDYLAILRGRLREGQSLDHVEARATFARLILRCLDNVKRAAEMLVEASPIGGAILEQITVQRRDVERLLAVAGTRSDEVGQIVNRLASRPFGELLLGLVEAVPRWASREGKRAQVEVQGGHVPVPPRLAQVLPDVLTHLLRNAIAHGIETTEARLARGKDEVGLIRVEAREGAAGPVILVEDDGGGLDGDRVKARARELGVGGGSDRDAFELAFADGLSTAATTGPLAGHGVGLGAVRTDLEQVDYRASLEAAPAGLRVVLSPNPRRPGRYANPPAETTSQKAST